MTNNTNYLVYQAYGIEDVFNEAMISIASLYKVTSETDRPVIYIYTDNTDYFKRFLPEEIKYIERKKPVWENWKGVNAFVHRAKIKMLLDFSEQYKGNILYCDTDTYFLKSPLSLFHLVENNAYVMHTNEGTLGKSVNIVFQKLEVFLKSYTYKGSKISSETRMWNAGVLGFRSEDLRVLQDVLMLADDLYRAYKKHVMEQLAFSFYFGSKTRHACEDTIYHYWDFKEYRATLKVFFHNNSNKDFKTWALAADSILPMELIKEKQKFLEKPYWKRKFLGLLGKKK